MVVMAAPGASLAMELRRLLPDLRRAVGDTRRVLVGFDRGGWSPALFAHMDAAGFDVLTWRKGSAEDVDPDLFTNVTYVDDTGRTHPWRVADTTVDLPVGEDEVFTMRQVSLTVPGTKTGPILQVVREQCGGRFATVPPGEGRLGIGRPRRGVRGPPRAAPQPSASRRQLPRSGLPSRGPSRV